MICDCQLYILDSGSISLILISEIGCFIICVIIWGEARRETRLFSWGYGLDSMVQPKLTCFLQEAGTTSYHSPKSYAKDGGGDDHWKLLRGTSKSKEEIESEHRVAIPFS